MATYLELFTLRGNPNLRQRIGVALSISANEIGNEQTQTKGHPQRVAWAQEAVSRLDQEAVKALRILLARNESRTVAQITGASDAAIQADVDAIIGVLAGVE